MGVNVKGTCLHQSRNYALEFNYEGLLQPRKWVLFSLMLICIDTRYTAYNVKMIFATNIPLRWATYLGTDTTHYSHCGPVFGESLFFFHTFYSKSRIWHAAWSSWLDCQWMGCDPSCSWVGCGCTDTLELKLYSHGYIHGCVGLG